MGVMFSDRRVLAALMRRKRDSVEDMKKVQNANLKYGKTGLSSECENWVKSNLKIPVKWRGPENVWFPPIFPFLTAWDPTRGAGKMITFRRGGGGAQVEVSGASVPAADSASLGAEHLKRLVCLAVGVDRIFSSASSETPESEEAQNQRHHALRPIAEQLHWQLSHEMESFRYRKTIFPLLASGWEYQSQCYRTGVNSTRR